MNIAESRTHRGRAFPRHILRGLAYLWAGSGSVVGLAAILVACLWAGLGVRRHDGTLEAFGGAIATVLGWLGGGRGRLEAITLGHVILARDAASLRRFREHERVHVRQWARWGPLFMIAYPLASVWAWIRRRGAYRGNRFECEAWRAGP